MNPKDITNAQDHTHKTTKVDFFFSQNETIISSIFTPFWSITKCDFDPHFFLKIVYFRRHTGRMAPKYYTSFYGRFILLGLIAPTPREAHPTALRKKKWGSLTGFEGKKGPNPKGYAIKWRISRHVKALLHLPYP